MDKNWKIVAKSKIPEDFQSAIGGHPLVAQVLYQRGYRDVPSAQAFLNPDLYQPASPFEFPDLELASKLISDALDQHHRILIWGDFDVDGQTSTTTLFEGLRELGGNVNYHIPVRGEETHGISQSVLEDYLSQGFDLLITCDTGISEHKPIQFVRNTGVPVIVTDHHTLEATLPPANAIINPQRLPENHPLRTLPGVGVAYKLIEGLFSIRDNSANLEPYLELVALGIVADVAEIRGDTRYLLQKGLASLQQTQRVGLQQLFEHIGLNPQTLNEDHIAFQIAPRMNAVGRLGDANKMVQFLTTKDSGQARVLATEIEALNAKRRFLTRQIEKGAEGMLQTSDDDRHAPAIVLHHPTWPGGIVGIVASRLVERYQKPALLLTGTDLVKGSARSIQGLNITEAIRAQSGLLHSFGGHPMAAGLALPEENLAAFKQRFFATIRDRLQSVEIVPEFTLQQEFRIEEISLDLVTEIQRLAPFGAGNPPPCFLLRDLTLVSTATMGQYGEHRRVIVQDDNEDQQKIIWWNGGDSSPPDEKFNLAVKLSETDFKGKLEVNIEWIDYQTPESQVSQAKPEPIVIQDRRGQPNPTGWVMEYLSQNPQASLWAEGDVPESIPAKSRVQLEHIDTLIIWTAPPSQQCLRYVLEKTRPKEVIVVGENPQFDSFKPFMVRLAGLVKYLVTHKSGKTQLEDLAAACAADIETVRIGLLLWEAKGKWRVDLYTEPIHIQFIYDNEDPLAFEIYQNLLITLLDESQAFRKFFQRGNLENLINKEFKSNP